MQTLPCHHSIRAAGLQNNKLSLTVDNANTQAADIQLTTQLQNDAWVCCPTCHNKVAGVAAARFFYPAVNISPLVCGDQTLSFKRITLCNILDRGEHSDDNGETYRRLAELSNDFAALIGMFGPFKGRALYHLPTAVKANVYIQEMEKSQGWSWIMANGEGKTVGTLSLRKIDPQQFALSGELAEKKIYNVGMLIHSDFQNKGVETALGTTILPQFARLKLDVEGYWMANLPENDADNHLASVLGFQHLKTMNVTYEGLTLGLFPGTLKQKLWVKLLD